MKAPIRRRVARIGAAVAMALLGALPARAAEMKQWRHGILEAKSDAGIIMMVGNGFAEKAGLKLEISQFKNDVVELQALLAGELDSFEGGASGSMIAAARGADVKIIGCHWPGLPYDVFVRPNIATVQDLKGKTFAISAPGATPDVVARALLARDGVPVSEVRFANLGSDLDRFKSLVAGVADATVVSGEYAPIAAKQGIKTLLTARDVVPNYLRLCIMATGKTLAARQDDAVHFLAAEMTALSYALSHRDETLALTRKITGDKLDDPRPAYIYDDALRSKSVDPTLGIPVDKLAWMQQQLIKDGNLPHPVDLAKVTDGDIRIKALALAKH
jgi:NitT/TauT family transport system substrate-binding protein